MRPSRAARLRSRSASPTPTRSPTGPTVQAAGQKSLAGGMTMLKALEVIRQIRADVDVPIVPMTYASPVMAFGEAEFCAAAAAAGVNGLIVPDVPADESGDAAPTACRENGIDLVPLLAPTSTDARIELACSNAGGFVYLVSVVGTTGAREHLGDRVKGLIERTRGAHRSAAPGRVRHLDSGARGGRARGRCGRRGDRIARDRGGRRGRRRRPPRVRPHHLRRAWLNGKQPTANAKGVTFCRCMCWWSRTIRRSRASW